MNRTFLPALALLAAVPFRAPAADAAAPVVSATLQVQASSAQLEFVRGEPIVLEGKLSNAGTGPFIVDDYGPYLQNTVKVYLRDAGSGRLFDMVPGAPASLVDSLTVRPGETASFTVDLRRAYDLSRTGRYHAEVFVYRGNEAALSRVVSFSVVDGVELSASVRPLSRSQKRPLRFALLYIDRNKRQELFLRVTEPADPSRVVAFVSLGSVVRVAEPVIGFAPDDLVTVVQQISRDRFARTTIDFSGETPRIVERDDSLVSMASVQEDINTRLLMSRLAEAETSGAKKEKKGVFGDRSTRTPVKPEQKKYSGEILAPPAPQK